MLASCDEATESDPCVWSTTALIIVPDQALARPLVPPFELEPEPPGVRPDPPVQSFEHIPDRWMMYVPANASSGISSRAAASAVLKAVRRMIPLRQCAPSLRGICR